MHKETYKTYDNRMTENRVIFLKTYGTIISNICEWRLVPMPRLRNINGRPVRGDNWQGQAECKDSAILYIFAPARLGLLKPQAFIFPDELESRVPLLALLYLPAGPNQLNVWPYSQIIYT